MELLPSLVLLSSLSKLGVVVTEHAPSSVALFPKLALSPELGVTVAKRALSRVTLLPNLVVSSPEHGIVVIVAAIDDGVTTKRCLVGFGSASRSDSKREQVPPGRR
jgi:hypothetical protein